MAWHIHINEDDTIIEDLLTECFLQKSVNIRFYFF